MEISKLRQWNKGGPLESASRTIYHVSVGRDRDVVYGVCGGGGNTEGQGSKGMRYGPAMRVPMRRCPGLTLSVKKS